MDVTSRNSKDHTRYPLIGNVKGTGIGATTTPHRHLVGNAFLPRDVDGAEQRLDRGLDRGRLVVAGDQIGGLSGDRDRVIHPIELGQKDLEIALGG